ncbi:MAG: dolichol kinase [Haloarculaceae archaeon]
MTDGGTHPGKRGGGGALAGRVPDEVARRLVHASTSAVPLSYLVFDPVTWPRVQAFLAVAVAAGLVLEVVRLRVGLDWWVFDRLTREYERENLAGYFLGAVGMTAVAFAFPPTADTLFPGLAPALSPVAVPAMLMLTVADPLSGLLGSGELRPAKQAWVLLATFGVATLLAVPFVPATVAVAGGVATTVADGVKPVVGGYVIDDNLTIPVGAATVMFAAIEWLPALG